MKPSEALRRYVRVNLTDDDFAWIGVVVTHWVVAEHYIEILIGAMAAVDEAATKDLLLKRRRNFDSQIRLALRLIDAMCLNFQKHQQIGRALMLKGKSLSTERNKFAHWLAQSNRDKNEIILIDFSGRRNDPNDRESFSKKDIQILGISIIEWLSDISHFIRYQMVDGPLASRTKWSGPRPVPATLEWDQFRTIRQMTTS